MKNKLLKAIIIYTVLYFIVINDNKINKKISYKKIFRLQFNKKEDFLNLPIINIFIAIISFYLSFYILY